MKDHRVYDALDIAYEPGHIFSSYIEPELIKECALKKDCSSIEILENNLKN